MNKNKKIVLSVISLLSFFSIAFWEGVYYFGGLSYLYHSQEIVKETLIFSAIALLALGIFIAVIVMLFKSPKVIRIVCTVLLIAVIPVSLFSSFVCMLGLMVGGSKGCSYTEDIANYGKYDEEFNVPYFPEAITDDMTVVDFAYFYKYADTDQTDIYLEVKFDNKKTMDKYLKKAKNAFSEKGFLTYENPYNSEYTDIVENRWVMHSSEGSFASIIEFEKYESGTKYVDMDYFSITYSYDELTIIYNYTYIGSDIFVGDNPDNGEYYPRFLERFGVEWSPDNEFKYVFKEREKTADITLSEKTSEQELTDVSENIERLSEYKKINLDILYDNAFNNAQSNVDKVNVNTKFSGLWKDNIDYYYNEIIDCFEKSNDEQLLQDTKQTQLMWEQYCNQQVKYCNDMLLSVYGSGTIVPLKQSRFEYEQYRERALVLYEQCLELSIGVTAPGE